MGEMIPLRQAAKILGVTDKSLAAAIKEGRFESGVSQRTGNSPIPQLFLSDDDEGYLAILESVTAGDPLPEFLVDRSQQKPYRRKKKEPDPETEAAADPTPSIPPSTATEVKAERSMRAKVSREYGEKEKYLSKIYRVVGDDDEAFVTSRPNIIHPEDIQDIYPEGGSFYLRVYRRGSQGEWDYDVNLSRDDRPIIIDPKPGFVPEEKQGQQNLFNDPIHQEAAGFMRETAQTLIDEKIHGDRQPGGAVIGEVTGVLSTIVQTQNTNFQQMMAASEANNKRMLEIMHEEAKMERERQDRRRDEEEDKRSHELEMLEKRYSLDRQRDEERFAKETLRLKAEAEDRDRRQETFIKAMQQIQSDRDVKMHELDGIRVKLLDDRIKETHDGVMEKIGTYQEMFVEKEKHLTEKFELMSAMAPGAMWTELFKNLGSQVNLPGLFKVLQQAGAQAQPTADQPALPGSANPPKQIGGVPMSMLETIKNNPEGRDMLESLLKQMAVFVEGDDPPAMYAQSILSLIQTTPGFMSAWTEMYVTPLSKIWEGVLKADSKEGQILAGEKAAKFWADVRAVIKKSFQNAA